MGKNNFYIFLSPVFPVDPRTNGWAPQRPVIGLRSSLEWFASVVYNGSVQLVRAGLARTARTF